MPLNALFSGDGADEKLSDFVRRNAKKIIFDITNAIEGLYQNNLAQGDARLDNVGIKNGKFVLFDYDVFSPANKHTVKRDLSMLSGSLLGHGVKTPLSYVELLDSTEGESLEEKLKNLASLQIE